MTAGQEYREARALVQMEVEWHAWGSVVLELERCGLAINGLDDLAKAIRRWGEELAELRRRQPPEVAADALLDVQNAYPRLAEHDGHRWVRPTAPKR